MSRPCQAIGGNRAGVRNVLHARHEYTTFEDSPMNLFGHSGWRTLGLRRGAVATSAVLALLVAVPPAHGLMITPTFDSSITSDPNAAAIEGVINQAIGVYESTFSNPINVTIDFQSMSSGLGQSQKNLYVFTYATFRAALVAGATSANDSVALAHLPAGATNPVTGGTTMAVDTANAKALGLGTFAGPNGFDGLVGLNMHVTDVGSPDTTGQYSLLATAEHEIDEVLGLGSSLGSGFQVDPSPEDLFRYNGSGSRSYTVNSNATAFFSINGTTKLAEFDNQADGGDWGDWQSNPLPPGVAPQVQDAWATPGRTRTLGTNEITALDVIGYNLAVVPEPAGVALMTLGALILASYGRCQKRSAFEDPV